METNVAQYQSKISNLLDKILLFECKRAIRDGQLKKFLDYLNCKERTATLINLPLFSEWILSAITLWHISNTIPATNIAAFTLNLGSLLSRDELRFCSMNNNNFYIKLVKVGKGRDPDVAPQIKLAYINLLASFLEHKSGTEWMMASSFWEDILQFSLTSQNVYIIRESRNFITKFLERSIEYDEKFCSEVVKKIMCPLGENVYKAIKTLTEAESSNEIMYMRLSPTLQLIGTILEYFLENSLFGQKDFRVVLIFLENFHLERRISDLLVIASNKYLLFDLGRIMFIMQFLEIYVNYVTNIINLDNVNNSIQKIMDVFSENLKRGNFDNVMKFCYFGQFYWNLVGNKVPCSLKNKINEPVAFADQLAILQSVPLYCFSMKYCYDNIFVDLEQSCDGVRDAFLTKIFKSITHKTLRIGYTWRDCLIMQPHLNEIAAKTLIYVLKSRKYYRRERAVIVFQVCIYVLLDVVNCVKESKKKLEFFTQESYFFSLLYEAIAVFIEDFKITWKDSIETFDVLDLSFDFLAIASWPSKVVVKVLKLFKTALEKYMAPNLAFLVDDTNHSTTAVMGPLLFAKLHDECADIRNSTLEVVTTVSSLASTKFPSLQKVLMDSDLPNLVVQMSTSDGESFVRATAIKCLQEMIQVEDIWNNVLKSQDLPQKMRHILLNETEGIVRVEAATFMCKAYEHQHFPEEIIDRVYDTMIHSSTADLHWEVKVRALGFWDQVITSYLQNQGMIDGSFPSVTFSKEHRKIVTLTDSEIKKRLQKVIHQLSNIGCLGVLISAIKDDCDMEVSKTAVNITQKLVELLKKYNIRADSSILTSPLPTEYGASSSASVSSGISADESMGSPVGPHPDFNDEIIDQIVNSKDINLLKNVYASSDYGSVLNYDIQVRKIVNPNEFLQFIQQDLNLVITEKKNWLNGIEDLGSLLDDMLKTYDDDINNMDCY